MPRSVSATAQYGGAAADLSIARHIAIALLWLPYNLQWGAFLAIAWPAQIEAVAGAQKEFWNGILLGLGAAVALVVAPLAGAASDRLRSRWGRRAPFLLAGGVVNIAALLFLGGVGKGGTLGDFAIGMFAVQVGANLWGGPYAGLIPDLVPPERHGFASGCMMAMTAIGLGAGAAAASVLSFFRLYALIAVALAVALAITLVTLAEPDTRAAAAPPRRWFFPPFAANRDFYWVLATRALVGMGAWSFGTYLLYYLQRILGLPIDSAKQLVAALTIGGGAIGLIAGFWAAAQSDRIGRRQLVLSSSAAMAAASLIYLLGAANPALWLLWVSATLFGIGNQVYTAVDWGFALDALPDAVDSGKDMGIWHASLVLPQILGPPCSALLLTLFRPWSLSAGYVAVFAASAFWFVLGSTLVTRIRGLR